MFKRIIFSVLILLCLQGVGIAQTLETRLSSKKTAALVSINANNYKPKGKAEVLLELDFFKNLDKNNKRDYPKDYKLVSSIYNSPKDAGVNAYPKSYIFVNTLDTNGIMVGALFHIADSKKFEKWVNAVLQKDKDYQKVQVEGLNVFISRDAVFSWNDKYGLIAAINMNDKDLYSQVNYDDPNYEAKIQEIEKQRKLQRANLLKEEATNILSGKVENPISENANFQIFANKSHDLGIWLNQEQFSTSIGSMLREFPQWRSVSMERFASRLKSYYKGYYDHILFSANNGNASVSYQTYLSDKIYELFGTAFNTRINPDFYKYVEGEKLLGLYAVSGDLKKLGNGFIEIYRDLFNEDLSKDGKTIAAAFDVMTVLLDEEDIFTLMKGDFMIAFTDVREMDVTYTDYQYDGDVYVGPTKKVRKEVAPVYVMMMGIGNVDNFMKFIKFSNVLGGLKQKDTYYEIESEGKTQSYLAIHNNILIISNDVDLITKNLAKADKIKKPVDAKLQKLTQDNPMLVYFNTANIIDALLKDDKNMSAESKKSLLEMKKDLGDIQVVGPNLQNKTFLSEGTIFAKNTKANSLKVLVRTINHLAKNSFGSNRREEAVTPMIEKAEPKKEKDEH